MRYPTDHKEKTHRRILKAASRAFRENGYVGTGIDAVMKDAGLTPGGFYSHFDSKEALLAETIAVTVERTKELLLAGLEEHEGLDWLQEVVRRYLSRQHRDMAADGCPLPAFTSDISRCGDLAKESFENQFRSLLSEIEGKLPDNGISARDRAIATIALCIGGLMLARAVKDPTLSDQILMACRRMAVLKEEK
ncbi:MAG: TetR/AcrR family transcriptional regulator [Acidobacteriota bacterium]